MAEGVKVLASNRRATFNYAIQETLECGVELRGTEVKSMKERKFSFGDAYAKLDQGELWLVGMHITPYVYGNINNHEPDRPRKLLVHRKELRRLGRKVAEKGLTLVPVRFYLKRGLVKLELGVGRGKKLVDKRETLKRRDQQRETERAMRQQF